MPRDLDSFLHGDKDGKNETERAGHVVKSGENFTHRLFTEKRTGYFINEDDYEEFLTLYCEELSNMNKQYLTERGTDIGQLRVDLDFKYDGEVRENIHTQSQVIEFAKMYMSCVKKYLEVPDTVELYILEKSRPTFDKIAKISRSGVHIQVPGLKTHAQLELQIRRDMMGALPAIFEALPLKNAWNDVYDESVIRRTQPWPVLGSRKGTMDGSHPYMIRYILDWDSETGDISVDTQVPKTLTPDLVRKLSVRSKPEEETAPTTDGAQIPKRMSTDHTRSVSRGRTLDRDAHTGSRGSSPGRGVYMAPLPETTREYYQQHVDNLSKDRYDGDHNAWIQVGQCLKNIHQDLEDVFLNFMAKSTKRDHNKARAAWNGFVYRVEGDRLGPGSLLKWSREDNYEGYLAIEAQNVDRLVDEAAMTQTEYDFAQVIKAKFRDEFKCANYRQNEWYQYSTHIWKHTEHGVELQKRLSSDIAKLFADKETAMLANITSLGQCGHAKEPDPSCQTCQAESKKKMYSSARLKLRRTGFKESVMRECRVLFYDKEFAKNIDDNKHLIAFNNGVYDTLTQTFRDGHPDDYISFCTKIDYAIDTEYHQFKCWAELRKFLDSILPNRAVRDYFLKHLSTCLSGVFTQRFHILTGSGSNGKSMLMNLCSTAFGEYCYKANIAMFTQKRNKAGAAAPELIRMKGKRFVFMSEPDEGEPLSTGFMKEMTSSEKVTGRDLFAGSKEMVEFDVQAKCHLACNDKPKVNSNDGGTWRRLKVIDFPMKFVEGAPKAANELPMDESIMHKVLSKEWAECFMAYLVHLHKEGKGLTKLAPPKEVDAYTQEYKVESDTIAKFITDYIHGPEQQPGDPEVEIPDPVSWSTITNTFREWKRTNEIRSGSTDELRKRLETTYGKMPRNGWTAFRFGVGE
jgi:P4 family phage/plasmid primase-like protien